MQYDNIPEKVEFSVLGPRSRSQWLVKEKHCYHSNACIYISILFYLHTNVEYQNILDKFEFEHSRDKVNVKVTILSKKLGQYLQTNFTKISSMTLSLTNLSLSIPEPGS